MTIAQFFDVFRQFLDFCAVYYVIQLGRCALFSFVILGIVFLLRKTILKNRIFLKGAIWSLFVPVLFVGKLKWFYETKPGVWLFLWWNNLCMEHTWVCWLYATVVAVFASIIHFHRRRVKKMVGETKKCNINGKSVFITDLPITPFSTGLFRAKIVLPKVILQEYADDEIQTIILHEQTHIRMGHLWIFWIWDVFRVLLWMNPFLSCCTKYLKEDIEVICDRIAIARGKVGSYRYGKILLRSMQILKAEQNGIQGSVTFISEQEFHSVKERITNVAEYKPYKRTGALCVGVGCVLVVMIGILSIKSVSYGRSIENDTAVIYNQDLSQEILRESLKSQKTVVLSDNKLFLNTEYLQNVENSEGVWIVYGGCEKLPGLGGGCKAVYVDLETLEKGGIQDISCGQETNIFNILFRAIY